MSAEAAERHPFRTSITKRDWDRVRELAKVQGETPQDVVRRLLSFYLLLNAEGAASDEEIVSMLKEKK